MAIPFLGIFLTILLLSAFHISLPISVTTTTKSSELAVVGEGKVEIAPDTAFIDMGITVNNAKTVKDAELTINTANNKIISALAPFGIKKEHIKTANYSIFPDYSYENNNSKIRGYNGNVTITVKVSDITKTSQIVETATANGANQINGIRYNIDKPEEYRQKAREKAIENARNEAKKLSKMLGLKLGKITNIVETNNPDNQIPPYFQEKAMGGAEGSPIFEPGTQTVSSTVTLYFEKK